MCGICGFTGEADAGVLRRMTEVLAHRGPDDSGLYSDTNINLGHRRLSIIDLTTAGHQPMPNEDESIWITFNGEIYNYQELKTELEKKGHKFKSNTDTEAIIHLYEEEKENCVKKLRGMFAFAIWDAKGKTLFLARDRMGKKPLYYTTTPNKKIIFASEIKSILQHPNVKRQVCIKALNDYLTLQYIPGPQTLFDGIMKLMPATTLVFKDGRATIKEYWDLEVNQETQRQTDEYYISKTRELLEESVRIRLMSDVPLGAFLSGGIDSSTLVALMSEIVPEPVKTFSIGYGVEGVDEVAHARVVAEHLKTDHQEIIIDSKDVVKEMEDIIWHLDEPIADPALIPAYFLSRFTRKKVTVTFGGGGSDEIFAGYRAYRYALTAERLVGLPDAVRIPAFSLMLSAVKAGNIRRYLEYVKSGEARAYWGQGTLLTDSDKGGIYGEKLKAEDERSDPRNEKRKLFEKTSGAPILNRLLYVDIKGWLTEDCMINVDKMSMAHSLEARMPYMDHKLVEFSMQIPQELKVGHGTEKYILRKIASPLLPKEIVARQKMGFRVPTEHWFSGEMSEYTMSYLSDNAGIGEYVDMRKATRMIKSADQRGSYKMWGLLALELWHRKFILEEKLA